MLRNAVDTATQTPYVLQILRKLEHDELSAAEVVLCTCVTSGAYRVMQSTHIRQVRAEASANCVSPRNT